jgi:hypothetical protein
MFKEYIAKHKEPGGVPSFDERKLRKQWNSQRKHVKYLADVPG